MAKAESDRCWVGFDLGGSKMLATVFNDEFKMLGSERKRTKGHEGAKAGIERIAKTIRGALNEAGVDAGKLGGIGVGCPGPLDLDRGIVFETPNLGWKNVKFKDALQDEFGCPAVIINDVDAGVYGEYRFGAGQGARCAVGVFPGTGIGGGCVYEGKILRGKKSSCMEIGHMQVMPDGPLCGCGRRGCLEAVASRLAIAGAVAQAALRGQTPIIMERAGANLADIRSGVLAKAIEEGDKVVEQIVRNAAGHIGTAVASVVNLLSPDIIVLGGGLVEAMPKLFTDEVAQTAKSRVLPSFTETFTVTAAKLGDDAAVMGAAAWARDSAAATSS